MKDSRDIYALGMASVWLLGAWYILWLSGEGIIRLWRMII